MMLSLTEYKFGYADVRFRPSPDICPLCKEPLEVHGSGERFPCPDGKGYFVEMEDGE
jgi:hypothetical protein